MKKLINLSAKAIAALILLKLIEDGKYENGRGKEVRPTWVGVWRSGETVSVVPVEKGRWPLIGLMYDQQLDRVFLGSTIFGRPMQVNDDVLQSVAEYNQMSKETGLGGYFTKLVDYTTDGTVHELSL
jgi:hypothetical protein